MRNARDMPELLSVIWCNDGCFGMVYLRPPSGPHQRIGFPICTCNCTMAQVDVIVARVIDNVRLAAL